MGKNPDPGSGMNVPDHYSESLESVFWVKKIPRYGTVPYLNSLMRLRDLSDPGSGIRFKHPGSATLPTEAKFSPYEAVEDPRFQNFSFSAVMSP